MRLEAAVGGLVCSSIVLGSSHFGHDVLHGLNRRHLDLHVQMKRNPSPTAAMVKRGIDVLNAPVWPTVTIPAGFTLAGGVEVTPLPQMAVSGVSGTGLAQAIAAATPAADPAAWNKEVEQKCTAAVEKLNANASSESGMSACYNVPFLDQVKGTFESELRIYNISAPRGSFASSTLDSLMISMDFPMATFSEFDGSLKSKRQLPQAQTPSNMGVQRAQLISIKKYIGQLNPGSFNSTMTSAQFKALLTPNISIYTKASTSLQQASTNINSTEASFVAGLFTTSGGNLTDPKYLLNNPSDKIIAAAQGLPTPFIVPGTSLGIFPTGLVITGIWVLAFVGTLVYGTLGRIKFRDEYRRQWRVEKESGIRRI